MTASTARMVCQSREAMSFPREDLAHLEEFLGTAPDAMLIVGTGGEVVVANGLADELFAAAEGELVGLCVEDLVPEELRETHVEHRRRFATAPSTRAMGHGQELRARRRDGSEFFTEISLSPVPGRRHLVLAAVRDLTTRKEADERLLEARLELDRRALRERQALEINDNVVQSLAVAHYRLGRGEVAQARESVSEALEAARRIITDLLAEPAPGELRRATSPGR